MYKRVLTYVRFLNLVSLLLGVVVVAIVVEQKFRADRLAQTSIDFHFASIHHLGLLSREVGQVQRSLDRVDGQDREQRELRLDDSRFLIEDHLSRLTEAQTQFRGEAFGAQTERLAANLGNFSALDLFDAETPEQVARAQRDLLGIALQIQQLDRLHQQTNTQLIQQRRKDAENDLIVLVLIILSALTLGSILGWKIIAVIKRVLRDQQRINIELFNEKERSQTTLTSIGDAVITTDAQGVIEFMNPVAQSLTQWCQQEARGKPITRVFNIVNEESGQPSVDLVERVLRPGVAVGLANHSILIGRDGEKRSIEDTATPIRNSNGDIDGIVIVFHDITHARRMAREMTWQATHDALTGLVNRYKFEEHLQDLVRSLDAGGAEHAFLYLDLDQFKIVNDTSGHIAGDELLKQISVVLKKQVRDVDTVARLGGDEFGILLVSCPLERASTIAEQVRGAIEEFHFVWEDRSFVVGCSIGLVAITRQMNGLIDIMRAADLACFAAKDAGRNRIRVYEIDNEHLRMREGEMRWVNQINAALREDRFVLYYQTIEALAGQAEGGLHFEILVRMISEGGEEISPMAFIPAAERYNLMPQIDRWVIRQAFAQLGRLSDPDIVFFSVNISGQSLGDETFLEFVNAQLDSLEMDAGKVCFEITETAAIASFPQALAFFGALKERGCLFALDDFGSGLSSFSYLKNMPVNFLKIDGGFVKDILIDPIDFAMVESINSIGHTMNIRTIAEFVESREIAQKLTGIGVDYGQGYGISWPRKLAEFEPARVADSLGRSA